MAGLTVAERLKLEKGPHDLKIGKSFEKSSKDSFHTIRYDFKPASVDTNQESSVLIGDDSAVEVTVPHVQGAGTTQTVYKGNKRSLQKECVLIINHDTGEIALEKLSYAIQLKKTRADPSVRMVVNPRPLTPIEKTTTNRASPIRKAPVKPHPSTNNTVSNTSQKPNITSSSVTHLTSPADIFGTDMGAADMELSSSSSSDSVSSDSGSSDDSGDEKDNESRNFGMPQFESLKQDSPSSHTGPPASFLHTLSQDLRLSESSDDDSD